MGNPLSHWTVIDYNLARPLALIDPSQEAVCCPSFKNGFIFKGFQKKSICNIWYLMKFYYIVISINMSSFQRHYLTTQLKIKSLLSFIPIIFSLTNEGFQVELNFNLDITSKLCRQITDRNKTSLE